MYKDTKYQALQAFTARLLQRGAAVVPTGRELAWPVSWSFLVSSAVFAFANNFRALEEVLLGNLLDLGTRCGINDRPQNKGCLNTSGSICPSVLWMSRQWNPA